MPKRVVKRYADFGRRVRLTSISHSYYIAWAVIYTFWFHPLANEWAHLSPVA